MSEKIKNFASLATTPERKSALLIAEAGLQAIDTSKIIREAVTLDKSVLKILNKEFPLAELGKIVIIGIGKCSLRATEVLEDVLGDRISDGVTIDVKPETESRLKKIRYFRGTHPFPSDKNIEASKQLVQILSGLKENDLVIAIVSGGGSTLLCLPEQGDCSKEKKLLGLLFEAGADIQEINTIRKQLSLARGGFLAKYAFPSSLVALIFSDVPGGNPAFISSGPTMQDVTTVEDAMAITAKYNISQTCDILNCGLIETPKDKKYFAKVSNLLAVSNELALDAMAEKARELGFQPEIFPTGLSGEARVAGETIADKIHAAPSHSMFLYGGETVVKVDHKGRGGRNGELALSALQFVKDDELIMTIASDGRDNGDYTGAIADTITKEKATKAGLDIENHLRNHDPDPFFEKTGDYLLSGDTGSNVSDLLIAIKR